VITSLKRGVNEMALVLSCHGSMSS